MRLLARSCIGIDEVGRGCLAGPLMAAAVWLDPSFYRNPWLCLLQDSKYLKPTQRREVAIALDRLSKRPKPLVHYGIGSAAAWEIDTFGLQKANFMAMERALSKVLIKNAAVLLDGRAVLPGIPSCAIVRGDQFVPTIQAASILAKVARDDLMVRMSQIFSGYGFESHKGYGTKVHLQAMQQLGTTRLHRRSFAPVAACLAKVA